MALTKENKIKLIVTPILLFGGYWFIYRNRKPRFYVDNNVDWTTKVANVVFGKEKLKLTLKSGIYDAGSTHSDKYKLVSYPVGNKLLLKVEDRDGYVKDRVTIDFNSRIIY